MTTLAERFIEARESTGMNKKQFAEAIGISRSSVTQIEKGDRKELKASTLSAIHRESGYLPDWIADGKGPKKTGEYPAGRSTNVLSLGVSDTHGRAAAAPPYGEKRSRRVVMTLPEPLFSLVERAARRAEISVAAEVMMRLQRSFHYSKEVEEFDRLIKEVREAKDLLADARDGDCSIYELIDLAVEISREAAEKQGIEVHNETRLGQRDHPETT